MKEKISTPKVLMVGPGRNVMGGISTVVNSYYELGLDKKIGLRYISSMEDGSKIKKLAIAFSSYIEFSRHINECDIVHVHMAAQASFPYLLLNVELDNIATKLSFIATISPASIRIPLALFSIICGMPPTLVDIVARP